MRHFVPLSRVRRSAARRVAVLGHRADDVLPYVRRAGAQAIVNELYAEGRATSLRVGAAALPDDTPAVLILNVDQPRPHDATPPPTRRTSRSSPSRRRRCCCTSPSRRTTRRPAPATSPRQRGGSREAHGRLRDPLPRGDAGVQHPPHRDEGAGAGGAALPPELRPDLHGAGARGGGAGGRAHDAPAAV